LIDDAYAPVCFTEGEKDADTLAALDLCSTTIASGKWTEEIAQALKHRNIWIFEDADESGRKRALEAAERLHPIATSTKVVRLPGLTGEPRRKDVTDWLDEMGHTKDELLRVIEDTPDWLPDHEPDTTSTEQPEAEAPKPAADAIALSFFSDLVEAKPKPWLIKNVIARGECSSWIAPPGKGKSALLTDIFVHGAHCMNWRGYRTRERFGGLYFALERVDLVKRRMTAHRLRDNLPPDLPIAIVGQVIDLMNRKSVDNIVDAIRRAEDHFDCGVGLVHSTLGRRGLLLAAVTNPPLRIRTPR